MKLELNLAKRKLILAFAFGFMCSTVSAAVKITDLGTLGGEQSIAFGINDYDQVVGTSWTAGGSSDFLYTSGQMIDLAQYNLDDAGAINNSGQITGMAIAADGISYPALYAGQIETDMGVTILGSLGGVTTYGFNGVALGINNTGQAVGYSYLSDGRRHAFIYENGVLHDINSFIDDDSVASAVNDSGTVVGYSGSSAYLYENGMGRYLTPFGSTESEAYAINNSGQVVGDYLIADHTAFHAFLYSNGTFTDIGNANSRETVAYSINEAGTIVGATWIVPDNSCRECQEFPHAFVYENGVMTDLNTLRPPGSAWVLAYAFAINNKGHVVGAGYIHGQLHAFLLSWSHSQSPSAAETRQDGRGMLAPSLPHALTLQSANRKEN